MPYAFTRTRSRIVRVRRVGMEAKVEQVDGPIGEPHRGPSRAVAMFVLVGLCGAVIAAAGGLIWNSFIRQVTAPVSVVVEPAPTVFERGEVDWVGYSYFLPQEPGLVAQPPARCHDRRAWAYDLGGSDAIRTRVLITVNGQREAEVSLQNLRVEVLARRPAPNGFVALCPPVGGPSVVIHGFDVSLDSDDPVAVYVEDEATPPSSGVRFTLDKGESEVFQVDASSTGTDIVSWRLLLDLVADGSRQTVTIDDAGNPFTTAGKDVLPTLSWDGTIWIPKEF